jgi:hypothetical protein
MAKKASDLYLGGAVPLNDAVVRVVRDEPGIGPEHVRRIVETANNVTFQAMFRKEAGDHRVISFPLADPGDVLKELNMRTEAIPRARSSFYENYVPGQDSAGDPFAPVKTAEEVPAPINDLWRMRQRVDGVREHLEAAHRDLAMRYQEAEIELCKTARSVILEGGSTVDISRALSEYSSNEQMTKLAMALIERHLCRTETKCCTEAVLSKSASAVPVPSHPLVQTFKTFTKVAMERFKVAVAIDNVVEKLHRLDVASKKAMS